jgi:hypothetical protein
MSARIVRSYRLIVSIDERVATRENPQGVEQRSSRSSSSDAVHRTRVTSTLCPGKAMQTITTFLAIALLGGTARAESANPDQAGSRFVSVGVNAGYGLGDGQGFQLGFEASFFHFVLGDDVTIFDDERAKSRKQAATKWLGFYADGIRDFGNDTIRASIGPELGYKTIGIDGGYLKEFGGADRMGVTVRGCLTVGYVAVCSRYSRMYDPGQNLVDLGVLIKVPIPL